MTATAAQPKAQPRREDIDDHYKWNLADIYPTEDDWQRDFDKAGELVKQAAAFKGRLAESSDTLWECLELRSELQMTLSSLFQYAYLNKDLDNRVSRYQEMTDRTAMMASQAGAALAFFEPEVLAMDEARLNELAAGFPETDKYDFYISELIRSKPHIRSGEVEEVLAMSAMVARGPDNIFTMLDDADMTYPDVIDELGRTQKLTKQRFARLLESGDQDTRRAAYEAFHTSYRSHVNTIAATLASSVNQDVYYSRVRRYESCLHNALDGDNIPVAVYHSLLNTTEKHIKSLHRYMELRKRVLGVERYYPYDVYCPLFPDHDFKVGFDDAVAEILKSVKPMGERYQQTLEKAFNSRWIDVYETEGKGSGGYMSGDNYRTHPFVLMNYDDSVDTVFTLAHEMGHALHSHLANSTQPFPKASYSIFTAEVASTLNEGLLMRHYLKKVKDKGERLYLIDRQLSGTMGTFFYQILYGRFELMVHEHVEKGGALSPDFLNELWGKLTLQYHGEAMAMDDDTQLKWSRIPHFYRMFYVYQYATAFAASAMILRKFLDQEEDIISRYLEMLSAGGSTHPIELLKICGVDMTTPDPVLATIGQFDELMDEMESLL